MSFTLEKRELIKRYMLEKIRQDDIDYIAKTAENFQISTTSVKRYLRDFLKNHILSESSSARTGYRLITKNNSFSYIIDQSLFEDKLYYQDILPHLTHLSKEALTIWSYTFMEIMNNAIEHSEGSQIHCYIAQDYLYTEISIIDNGIGVFKKIQTHLNQLLGYQTSYQDALTELYKGKFTTASTLHSGEGIFFTSKMLNRFTLWSDNTVYSSKYLEEPDWIQSHLIAYYTRINKIGTAAIMLLENQTSRNIQEVFNMYAPIDEGFNKTTLPIKTLCPFGNPIARSQARRILYRLEEFKTIEFDFTGVEFMGQGFADEIFRVFQKKYPEIQLIPVNANASVSGMIKHVRFNL